MPGKQSKQTRIEETHELLVKLQPRSHSHQHVASSNMLPCCQFVARLLLDTQGYMLPWCKRGFTLFIATLQ